MYTYSWFTSLKLTTWLSNHTSIKKKNSKCISQRCNQRKKAYGFIFRKYHVRIKNNLFQITKDYIMWRDFMYKI